MEKKAAVLAKLRNHFYRDSYRRMMLLLSVSLLLNVMLGAASAWLFVNKPKPEYFATSPDGKLIPMIPLQVPYLTTNEVLAFANQAAISSTSYDYMNYRRNLQAAQRFYTTNGYNNYVKSLTDSGMIKTLGTNGLVSKSTILVGQRTAVCAEGVDPRANNRYTWIVEVPIGIKYAGVDPIPDTQQVAKLTLIRVSTAETPNGVLIKSIALIPLVQNYQLCKGVVQQPT